jgi:hypothetical protein
MHPYSFSCGPLSVVKGPTCSTLLCTLNIREQCPKIVPCEGLNCSSNSLSNTRRLACKVSSIAGTRSAYVEGCPLLCSSVTVTWQSLNSWHHFHTCYTVITFEP